MCEFYVNSFMLLMTCVSLFCCFFFKQKTAYEMRISDWSSDVCSSDLEGLGLVIGFAERRRIDGVVYLPARLLGVTEPQIAGAAEQVFQRLGLEADRKSVV